MAITDILTRISRDSAAEAAEILAEATAEAARIVAAAESKVATERKVALDVAERAGEDEAATLIAGARLVARDGLLSGKRVMAEQVLERAREALESLPDDEYREFIAAEVAQAAVGGEDLLVSSADSRRLKGLAERLSALGVDVSATGDPAPIDRGVLLTGDRVRVEISPATVIADRRDELLSVAARELFGEKE
ncbi:MAG: hypothetical protein JXA36_00415 [Coriobacteriia bacterium]|nr:hypothetical protein [Coriobacteriia bacterium]